MKLRLLLVMAVGALFALAIGVVGGSARPLPARVLTGS